MQWYRLYSLSSPQPGARHRSTSLRESLHSSFSLCSSFTRRHRGLALKRWRVAFTADESVLARSCLKLFICFVGLAIGLRPAFACGSHSRHLRQICVYETVSSLFFPGRYVA